MKYLYEHILACLRAYLLMAHQSQRRRHGAIMHVLLQNGQSRSTSPTASVILDPILIVIYLTYISHAATRTFSSIFPLK